jgi:cobalt-zinc-cadmium efflux system protein
VNDSTRSSRPLLAALALTVVFLGVEIVGGILAGSLALLADAGHMATDAGALGLSLFALWLSSKPRSLKKTFGWYRFEIFAALVNGLGLWLAAAIIAWEAVGRLRAPAAVKTGPMLVIASFGLAANVLSGWILRRSGGESLNLKAAFLHVVWDALGNVGVIAAAAVIRFTGWKSADPVAGLALCVLMARSAWGLIREAFQILMEGTPEKLNLEEIRRALLAIPGVLEVHDLHIWTVTSGFVSLTAHLVVADSASAPDVLEAGRSLLEGTFGLRHSTIQIETKTDRACWTESCD